MEDEVAALASVEDEFFPVFAAMESQAREEFTPGATWDKLLAKGVPAFNRRREVRTSSAQAIESEE